MKIVAKAGREDIAVVYIAEFGEGELVEFVEAVQPPIPREKKWVLLISTLYGCPVECAMCDAGGFYLGKISKKNIIAQIDFLVQQHYKDFVVPCKQFKIQFSRMGEPAFNMDVLDVLEELPERYEAPGMMPSVSTIAPYSRDLFFQRLLEIKNEKYSGGHFQFQFSIHTTDEALRRQIVPVKTWDFRAMGEYGERFYQPGDRKITLNFALAEGNPVDPDVLLNYFDPEKFLIKITPLNPTYKALDQGLCSYIDPYQEGVNYEIATALRSAGYRVILSIGDAEENLVGSNCGQYVLKHLKEMRKIEDGYQYQVEQMEAADQPMVVANP
jgi:23S rRNA (adenine2503-C2)-methyltransferase